MGLTRRPPAHDDAGVGRFLGGLRRFGRVWVAIGLVAGVTVLDRSAPTAHAATFNSVPDRLYMIPVDGETAIPSGVAPVIVTALSNPAVGVLVFNGSTDNISRETREIVVGESPEDDDCDMVDDPDVGDEDYIETGCVRLVLSASLGRLALAGAGAASVVYRDYTSGPGTPGDDNLTEWLWELPSGAFVDVLSNGDGSPDPGNPADTGNLAHPLGFGRLEMIGTIADLNAAVANLRYVPPPGYRSGVNPTEASITVSVTGDNGTTSHQFDVRVLEINQFPEHDGPATFDADAAVEEEITGFTVEDADNDEPSDGPDDEMLLVAWLRCEGTIEPDTGFQLASSSFAPVVGTLAEVIEEQVDPDGAGDAGFVTAALAALDVIDPELRDLEIETSNALDWTTAFGGVGTLEEVEAALATVTFRHDVPEDTCTLITIVSDLGNNGLPVQWIDGPNDGTEIPMLGFDWNVLTITTGALLDLDISFDSAAPIVVVEGNDGNHTDVGAALVITPPIHPAFRVRWDILPIVGDPEVFGVATANSDFNGTSNNTLFVPENAGTIPFPNIDDDDLPDAPNTTVRADDDEEPNETFRFQLVVDEHAWPDGWALDSQIPTRTVVIVDDDRVGYQKTIGPVSDATALEGDAGTTTMTFTVGLSEPAQGNESFVVNTVDGDATSPADYTALVDEEYSFEPGATSVEVEVEVIGDVIAEGDHTFTLEISGATNAALGPETTGTGTIEDDDDVSASIDDVAVSEGNSATTDAVFTVTLSGAALGGETVQYATSDISATAGVDYVATSGTLTFETGDETATITVPVNGDTVVEPDETFAVTLSDPDGLVLATATATGTITNDDQPSVIAIADATIPEGTTVPLTISMSNPTGRTCTVLVTTSGGTATSGSDYVGLTAVPVTLTGVASATVDLTTLADALVEGDETLTAGIALAPASPADCALGDATAAVTITDVPPDPDAPTVTIDDVTVAEGDAGTTEATFTIMLSGAAPGGTIDFATVDGTAIAPGDYGSTSGSITFTDDLIATVTVTIVGDWSVEPDETFTVVLSNGAGVTIADAAGTGTITDDDDPSVITVSAGPTVVEGAVTPITIAMTDPTGHACTVHVTTTDATATAAADYTALAAVPVVLNGVASATIDLTTLADALVEGDETLTVAIALAPGSTADCVLGATTTATVTITDVPPDPDVPVASIAAVTMNEGDSGTTTFTFTVTLTGPGNGATIDYATSDGTATAPSDYAAASGTITFPGAATTATISVAVVGDTAVEPNETFTVLLSNGVGVTIAVASATGTITNDDQLDDPAPDPLVLDVPDDIVRPNDPGLAGAVVTWPAPTATGGTPPVTIVCSRPSGDFFPLGVTTVTCTATDAAPSPLSIGAGLPLEIAALVAVDSFTVTVVDVEPPVIGDNPDLTRTTPTGSITVDFPLPPASDNSGIAPTVACAVPSGSSFPLGIATVVCTATDAAGNQASSTFTITVVTGPAPTPGGQLPVTGGSLGVLLSAAVGLVVVGVILHGARRRTTA